MAMQNSVNNIKTKKLRWFLTIIIGFVALYFFARATEAWLPSVYSAIEIYTYNTINYIWYIVLAIAVLTAIINEIFKNQKHKYAKSLSIIFRTISLIASFIFCTWLIFNIAGLGNTHYMTKTIMTSDMISAEEINEESNGQWILKVQDFLVERINKDYFYQAFDNLKKDISSINPFIQFFIYLLLMVVGVVLLLLIFFLWLFIDLLPLILVPILGVLLLVPVKAVTHLIFLCLRPKEET